MINWLKQCSHHILQMICETVKQTQGTSHKYHLRPLYGNFYFSLCNLIAILQFYFLSIFLFFVYLSFVLLITLFGAQFFERSSHSWYSLFWQWRCCFLLFCKYRFSNYNLRLFWSSFLEFFHFLPASSLAAEINHYFVCKMDRGLHWKRVLQSNLSRKFTHFHQFLLALVYSFGCLVVLRGVPSHELSK